MTTVYDEPGLPTGVYKFEALLTPRDVDTIKRMVAEARADALDEDVLVAAMNAHWVWIEHRLHVCVGRGCAANIVANYRAILAERQP